MQGDGGGDGFYLGYEKGAVETMLSHEGALSSPFLPFFGESDIGGGSFEAAAQPPVCPFACFPSELLEGAVLPGWIDNCECFFAPVKSLYLPGEMICLLCNSLQTPDGGVASTAALVPGDTPPPKRQQQCHLLNLKSECFQPRGMLTGVDDNDEGNLSM